MANRVNRTLYVIPTCYTQLWFMWNVQPNVLCTGKQLFIQCDMAGNVNWDKNSVYTIDMLKDKKHIIIS